MDVLQLDVSGRPQAWMTVREAAILYACDAVAWTLGDPCHVMRGGVQRATGKQSRIEVHSIIAVRGSIPSRTHPLTAHPVLTPRRRPLDELHPRLPVVQRPQGQPPARGGQHDADVP